jgi:acyl carrier protein
MMNDYEARLVKCFSAVFSGLSEAELRAASSTNLASWDSITTVTLIALIEEEFKIEVDVEDLERLTSFDSVLGYLKSAEAT